MMKEIFFVRKKGREPQIRQMLAVYSDGKQYRLHYLELDRTDPTREERENGEEAKRFETLNQEFYLDCGAFIRPSDYPFPKLTRKFIRFLKDSDNDSTKS